MSNRLSIKEALANRAVIEMIFTMHCLIDLIKVFGLVAWGRMIEISILFFNQYSY